MCKKIDCQNCKKATWVGCGLHVKAALMGIPEADRCPNWKKGVTQPCNTSTSAPSAGDTTAKLEERRSALQYFCSICSICRKHKTQP